MKKLNLKSKLKKAANVLAGIFTFATVAGGISALATTVVNPVDLWWSIAPIEIAYFNYVITYTMVIEYLEFLQTYYWYAVGASSGAIVLGLAAQIRSMMFTDYTAMAALSSGVDEAKTVGWWQFDEGSGSAVDNKGTAGDYGNADGVIASVGTTWASSGTIG